MELAPPGAADLTGILSGGRRLEVEVKSASGRQRENQIAWETMTRKQGAIYVLARSTNDVLEALAREGYSLK